MKSQSMHHHDENSLSVVVLQELIGDSGQSRFMKVARSSSKRPTYMYIKPYSSEQFGMEGLDIAYSEFRYKQHSIRFFSFPEALGKNFLLTALQLPGKVAGFILVIDISSTLLSEIVNNSELYKGRTNNPSASGLAWIRQHDLPWVLVATGQDSPTKSTVDLREFFSIEQGISVISCPSHFDKTCVESALSALLDHS